MREWGLIVGGGRGLTEPLHCLLCLVTQRKNSTSRRKKSAHKKRRLCVRNHQWQSPCRRTSKTLTAVLAINASNIACIGRQTACQVVAANDRLPAQRPKPSSSLPLPAHSSQDGGSTGASSGRAVGSARESLSDVGWESGITYQPRTSLSTQDMSTLRIR